MVEQKHAGLTMLYYGLACWEGVGGEGSLQHATRDRGCWTAMSLTCTAE